jgi:hypothetical protein
MNYYIDINTNDYYFGDKRNWNDTETTERPSSSHVYIDGAWVLNAELARAAAKSARENLIKQIQVEISSGKVFDGNDEAQFNMLTAISIAAITGQTETEWTLANNDRVVVTLAELQEAFSLAGIAKSQLWDI